MINDPRKYTLDYPQSNIIISQALDVVAGLLNINDLTATIAKFLKNENDALINVALNLAPNFLVCHTIWHSLNQAITSYNASANDVGKVSQDTVLQNITSQIFAIPVILVAGSKSKVKLKGILDTEKLNTFFHTKQIFSSGTDNFISGKLIEPKVVAQIKPSQYYYWLRNLLHANLWLPINVQEAPIEIQNEGVFLRFLVGITIGAEPSLNQEAFRQASMELMQFVGEELKSEHVTLFPIPFAPVNMSEAFVVGDNYRKEIAIQVAVSNIARKIREQGMEPVAHLSTANEAIKITVTCEQKPDLSEMSLWHLNHFDDFDLVVTKITDLLHDMNINIEYD